MHPDLKAVLYSEQELQDRVAEMGAQITKDYADAHDLIVISVLRGAAIYMADLVRAIELPLEMDYMAVSSYGAATKSSGVVRIIKDLSSHIEGRDVIIAEDILDSGLTLKYLTKTLASRNPRSLEIAALLRKQGAQKTDIECKYVGFECPPEFIVGYGLDYAERYRNLPYIGILDPSVYGGD
ncbi:MAG: hypoxanthine phosphoribosyltransferase [Coriobacteriales bacterium]|jgi:hypoxanthine phosphoribosyltransferase